MIGIQFLANSDAMKHKKRVEPNRDLYRPLLIDIINPNHELVRLEKLLDWDFFEREWNGFFPSTTGRPATAPRLVAGLLYLQHLHGLSDEGVLNRWLESPYYQHFCGMTFFEHRLPIDPSSLVRWRKRIGEEGMEWLLTKTIEAAQSSGAVSKRSMTQVIVDTTVMEKAIAHPTDSRLLETARLQLVKQAVRHGIVLRQNYNRVAPRLAIQAGRYAHAKQFKRMRRVLKFQRTILGRLIRDIERKVIESSQSLLNSLALAKRLHAQQPKDKKKLTSWHAPEVECIGKGKARKPYEFGVKATITTTLKEGLVIGMRTLPGNPYDGHSLREALEQTEILTGVRPQAAYVDRGYRGHGIESTEVYISGQKRGVTRSIKQKLKRRSAIEPIIGHMKTEGRLDRCTLKGELGDAMFALLCGCGQNLRLILNHLRSTAPKFYWALVQRLFWAGEPAKSDDFDNLAAA